jgi:hypothetical protein
MCRALATSLLNLFCDAKLTRVNSIHSGNGQILREFGAAILKNLKPGKAQSQQLHGSKRRLKVNTVFLHIPLFLTSV